MVKAIHGKLKKKPGFIVSIHHSMGNTKARFYPMTAKRSVLRPDPSPGR
jgi:hypothetical protein